MGTVDESHSDEIDIQKKEMKEESLEAENKVLHEDLSKEKSVVTIEDYDVMIDKMLYRNGTTWNCARCVYKSRDRGSVREHVESHGIVNASIVCSFCGADFGRRRTYRKHIKQHHKFVIKMLCK